LKICIKTKRLKKGCGTVVEKIVTIKINNVSIGKHPTNSHNSSLIAKLKKKMFNWLWGKPVATTATPTDVNELMTNSIQALTAKRMKALKQAHDAQKEAQRLNSEGKKQEALQKLRQKKEYDQQAASFDAQILKLEQTNMAVENTAVAVDVTKTMQQGSDAIKQNLKVVTVDDVDKTMDDLEDAMSDSKDVLSAVSRPFGVQDPEEEAALWQQLEDWGTETQLPNLPQRERQKNHGLSN